MRTFMLKQTREADRHRRTLLRLGSELSLELALLARLLLLLGLRDPLLVVGEGLLGTSRR